MSEPVDLAALSLAPLHWWRSAAPDLRAGRPPGEILQDLLDAHPDYGREAATLRARALDALSRAAAHGVSAIAFDNPAYPPLLAAIADPPPVLWVRGSAEALRAQAVAIVGSRSASAYALQVAERLAADVASRGLVVISGLARGVDSAAHCGALQAGATVAVLGCGADIVYPAEHRALAASIAASGAIVSELAPGTAPRPEFFPRRNRIISGLSRAVVIVEAGEKSGSLITARCAAEQGRDVLAVPGNVLCGRNRGGHALLRDGAKIVESADDILDELQLPTGAVAPASGQCSSGCQDPVLASLTAGEACDLDSMAERTGLAPSRLLPRLFALELQGFVRRAGGGRFVRVDRTC